MKRGSLLMSVVLAGALATPAFAQNVYSNAAAAAAAAAIGSIGSSELGNWANYAQQHPDLATALQANAALINNPAFMSQHPQLASYLAANPTVAAQLQANPNLFLSAVQSYNPGLNPNGEWFNTGPYLQAHPDVAAALYANPALINTPASSRRTRTSPTFSSTTPSITTRWCRIPTSS